MKPTFYTRLPILYKIVLITLYIILTITTVGIVHILYCDFFLEHKYWLNRRILLKYLKSKDAKLLNIEVLTNCIVRYTFTDFKLWYWPKQLQISLDDNVIGLYTATKIEDRKVIEIIRKLNTLNIKQ